MLPPQAKKNRVELLWAGAGQGPSLGWPRLTRSKGSGAGRGPAKGLPARWRSMLWAAGQPLTGAFEVQPLIIFIYIHIFLYIYADFFFLRLLAFEESVSSPESCGQFS